MNSLWKRALLLALLSVPGAEAEARVAAVRCETTVSTYTWQPLPLKTIKRVVQGRVLQVLTRTGRLTLMPTGAAGKKEDLTLKVAARIIEDAQQFSVFISAIPRRQSQAGSLAAVATRSIRGRDHKGIQQEMERAADQAANKLSKLLTPYLALITSDGPASGRSLRAPGKLPSVDWARALQLGAGKGAGRISGAAALRAFSARAGKEASARMSLARCASRGGQRGMRTRCIDALAQLARRHPSAQRAIIAVLFEPPPRRRDNDWQKARRRAFRITTSFSGAALQEAIQSWLYLLASDHSDNYYLFGGRREDYLLLETISRYLARNPAVPNLDLALARCSRPAKKKAAPPDQYCLRVMKAVPQQRRLALLYRQLAAPPKYSFYDPWKAWLRMLESVIDRNRPLHPAVEQICMQRIQRSFWDPDRRDCLGYLSKQGRVNDKLLKFLVGVFVTHDSSIDSAIRDALRQLVKRKPALCPALERLLGPRLATGAFPKYYRQYQLPAALKWCRQPPSRR